MSNPLIYLASASPRRTELLTQIGVRHRVSAVDVDESTRRGESPGIYVTRLARAKAGALWERLQPQTPTIILGSDTTVALGDEIFGKPSDRADGLRMLERLSGQTHQVYTAVALQHPTGLEHSLSVSEVTFRRLSPAEAAAYWNTGEPRDKAGGYAVQGIGAMFISRIVGSYSGIMGLPLFETAELLKCAGVDLLVGDAA